MRVSTFFLIFIVVTALIGAVFFFIPNSSQLLNTLSQNLLPSTLSQGDLAIGDKLSEADNLIVDWEHTHKGITRQEFIVTIKQTPDQTSKTRETDISLIKEGLVFDNHDTTIEVFEFQNITHPKEDFYECNYNITNCLDMNEATLECLKSEEVSVYGKSIDCGNFTNPDYYFDWVDINNLDKPIVLPERTLSAKATDNEVKKYKVVINTPLNQDINGWGSTGKLVLNISGNEFYDYREGYSSWWNVSYDLRKNFNISNTYVDDNLTDFPLYVNFTDLDIGTNSSSNGTDIRFTNGTTELSFEVENYSTNSSGTAFGRYWVRVPNIANLTETPLWIYYKNNTADGGLSGEDIEGTWNANFKAVYHFKGGSLLDSTSNNYDGTISGTVVKSLACPIGDCYTFAGTDDYITISSASSILSAYPYTMTGWGNSDSATVNQDIVSMGSASTEGIRLRLAGLETGDPVDLFLHDGGVGTSAETSSSYTTNSWYYASGRGVSTTSRFVYKNAGSVGTDTTSSSPAPSRSHIGILSYNGGLYGDFDGEIDEVRLSDVDRGVAWIKFEYNNIIQADNELTWGPEEANAPVGDITNPTVALLEPINNTNTTNTLITLNASMTDETELYNSTLYIWNSTAEVNVSTFLINGTTNSTNITFIIPDNDFYIWNYYVCDNSTNCLFNATNYTFLQDNRSPYFTGYENISMLNNETLGTNINATDALIGLGNYSINDTTNFLFNTTGWLTNITGLSIRIYWLNLTINDTLGNENSTLIFVNVTSSDITSPDINFTEPTMSGANATNFTLVNVTSSDDNTFNITIFLFNETGLHNQTSSTSSPFFINFTNLPDGFYLFNATSVDSLGNSNSTETRNITIDTIFPQVEFIAPTPADQTVDVATTIEVNLSILELNLQNVTWNWNGTNFSVYDNDLIFFLNFNNRSALGENQTLVKDLSYNNFTGHVIGREIINETGKYGGSITLNDSINSYLNFSTVKFGINNSQLTISAWVWVGRNNTVGPLGTTNPIIDNQWGTDIQGFQFMLSSSTGIIVQTGNDTISSKYSFNTYTDTENWHHVVVIIKEAEATQPVLYIDGINYTGSGYWQTGAFNRNRVTLVTDSPETTVVGGNNDLAVLHMFNGSIDDLMIWKRALTELEVEQLYLSSLNKHNETFYNFYATEKITGGYNYTYFGCGQDIAGSENCTGLRHYNNSGVDTTPPVVTIVYPENITYSTDVNQINYTSDEIGDCWYSRDGGLSNSSNISTTANFTSVTSVEGDNNWTVWCNDTSSNEGLAEITFFKDTLIPDILIDKPINNTNTTSTTLEVNYTVNDTYLNTCWWTRNKGISNSTISCGTNITGQTWSEGLNTVIVFANDTVGNENSSKRTFRLDTTPPVFDDILNKTILLNESYTQDINASDAGIGFLGNYSINWTTVFEINTTGYIMNISGLSERIYWINVSVNDTLGNLISSEIFVNVTEGLLDTEPPTIDNLRNFRHTVNLSFSQSITATDNIAVDTYALNDTDVFNITQAGLITNISALSNVSLHWFNLTVKDTSLNEFSGEFYINITTEPPRSCVNVTTSTITKTAKHTPYVQLCYGVTFE